MIFVSYSHKQTDWVHSRLIPVLRAAGGKVLVDVDRFKSGRTVIGQMDAVQREAHRHLLIITADYATSEYCRYEMDQAIKSDPDFAKGKVIPVMLDNTPVPSTLAGTGGLGAGPIYVDLQDDSKVASWALLLKSCSLSLSGTSAVTWLSALDQTNLHLQRSESVNLVVGSRDINWRLWIDQLKDTRFQQLPSVDLQSPRAVSRAGLIGEMLIATGRGGADVPRPPDDLPFLARAFESGRPSHLVIKHFDYVKHRSDYGFDLFCALRWLVMDAQRLILLVQSKVPMGTLLPPGHELSAIDFKTVELG